MLTENDISRLEQTIGYTFKDKALIIEALTHSSYVNEHKINKKHDYERLEFLTSYRSWRREVYRVCCYK